MSRPVIIVDTETTGLDPARHEIWEIAVIGRQSGIGHMWRMKPDLSRADPQALMVARYYERTTGMCRRCFPRGARDLTVLEDDDEAEWSDPVALMVARYYERTTGMCRRCFPRGVRDLTVLEDDDEAEWSDPVALAALMARLLDGAILVAANPAFDAGFLAAFLRHHGEAPTWHYRLRDIGSMAWGWLHRAPGLYHGELPPIDASTDEFARALGVDPGGFERHSALGDCLLLAAMLDVIERGDL